MSGGVSIRFVEFPTFLFDFDRVHCASFASFLVRNWCGRPSFAVRRIDHRIVASYLLHP